LTVTQHSSRSVTHQARRQSRDTAVLAAVNGCASRYATVDGVCARRSEEVAGEGWKKGAGQQGM